MAKYRKKPVVVDAVHYDGANLEEVANFIGSKLPSHPDDMIGTPIFIKTLEGYMRTDVGDWIIKGVAGEFYPCKPDIFAQTYEKAGEDRG
jgi:hypothetical protein